MIGSRAWFALMRRNCIYRKRNWLCTIFEMILPFCFVWIMVALRNAITSPKTPSLSTENKNTTSPTQSLLIPEYVPNDFNALIPLSYYDYVTVLQARRTCVQSQKLDKNNRTRYEISGVHNFGRDWQVPFMKCDHRKCRYHQQDAKPFCEYSFIGIAPSTTMDDGGRSRAQQFQQYMYSTWPILQQQPSSTISSSNSNINETIKSTTSTLPFGFDFVQLFESEEAMEKYVRRVDYGTISTVPKMSMGIVFNGNSTTNYKYTIRQNSTNLNVPANKLEGNPVSITTPPTTRILNEYARSDFETCSRGPTDAKLGVFDDSCTGLYIYNGVIATQRLVGDFILSVSGASQSGYSVSDGGVSYVQFPQKALIVSGFFTTVKDTAPVLIILGLLFPVASMIGYIVQEKQLRQKELMKMMSVTESDIGWAWFMTFASFNVIAAMCAAVVSAVLYEHSTTFLLSIYWILSLMATTTYCMTIATITSKSSRAVLIGLLVFFSGVFLTIAVDYEDGQPSVIGVLCIHPAAAFAYGLKVLGHLEDLNIGLTEYTMQYSFGRSGLSMMKVIQYLSIDAILWGILSWYLNRVIKPDFGQALPLWFPFAVNYWLPNYYRHNHDRDDSKLYEMQASVTSSRTRVHTSIPTEPVSENLKGQARQGKSIEIRNLRKEYGNTTAVNGLNLSMYCGQITALLGHNGAGKTTTMNMLTGATAPTSGHATVAGKSIRTEMPEIRQDIGICLQHDCLFPQLTVREHLQFFARLKGLYSKVSFADAEQQVDQSLMDVALSEKRNTLSKHLSGGMKRKLSVAMAFCGGSKVVLLDEPTSGMDPFSRRFTWNVIRRYKKDRVIILTTHFMDEADILGDRIAIMAEGQLRCVGSSLFLKKTYGVGYQLTIDRGPGRITGTQQQNLSPIDTTILCPRNERSNNVEINQEARVTQIVKDSVRDAVLLGNVGSELSYQLPLSAASSFEPMFSELDEQVDDGSISCYGVSVTTLNEVFLMVARGEIPAASMSEASTDSEDLESIETYSEHCEASVEEFDIEQQNVRDVPITLQKLETERLFARHVVALMKKRALNFRRDRKAWICTTIVPSVFVCVGFLIVALTTPGLKMDPLVLNPRDYNSDLELNQITFNSPDNPFTCQPGICSYRQPVYVDKASNEQYTVCGYQSKLGLSLKGFVPTNQTCSVSDSSNVMSTIESSTVSAIDTDVTNIEESSEMLKQSRNQQPFPKFGAIWFSHFQDSRSNGRSYNDDVAAQCSATNHLLNYSAACSRFDGVGYTVQYNYTALHSALLFEQIANEALVRRGTNNLDITIETTIQPLPVTSVEEKTGAGINAFLAWFLVVVSFPFIGGAFGSFVVHEKSSKAKHLQTVAGVEPSAYWLSTYLWDTINYQIPLWATIILMFIFDVDILTTANKGIFSGILSILFLFGPALAGFTYCASFAFSSASSCNIFIITSGFLIGMGGPIACSILIILAEDPRNPNPSLLTVQCIITWILRFTPTFCLGKGLFNAINIELFIYLKGDSTLTAWTEPILLYEVYFLLGQCVLFPLMAIQLDKWSSNPRILSIWRKFLQVLSLQWIRRQEEEDAINDVPDDDDVLREQQLVQSGKSLDDRIVIKNLSKIYDDGKVAVSNLNIGIAPGECFGLLGINGAGKTTTLSMLTAEFPPTSGDAILNGHSVSREPQKIRRLIGYCPQFDALFGCLTGREHIHLYGAVKGIPSKILSLISEKKLKEVGLLKSDWDRMSKEYSGGMKRRLSLACATIGQPSLLFLDECSTGVDPISQRDIWKLVAEIVAGHGLEKKDKPSVILTTHNMDECEALCPRIGIMANGKLCCLGSAQHLKNKFGNGYQVELNVTIVEQTDDDYANVKAKLSEFVAMHGIDEDATLDLSACVEALKVVAGNSYFSDLLDADDSAGYAIRKDALSPHGVAIDDLAIFAALEMRILKLEKFVQANFSIFALRERQDSRVRYSVNDVNLKISSIFSIIEENKDRLLLADYSVSQTSLEQVFNMHAAEAEQRKIGRIENFLGNDCRTADSTHSVATIGGQLSLNDNDPPLNSDFPDDEDTFRNIHPFDEYRIP